ICYNAFIRSARFFPALLAMRARHVVLLTPSISLRLDQALSCTQIMRETPQIPLYVFNSLRTLSFSVSSKSFTCNSYENSRVYTNNSQTGTPHELAPSEAEGLLVYPEPNVRRGTVLKFFLFTLLRTLLRFLALSENSTLSFSGDSALFPSQQGCGGYPSACTSPLGPSSVASLLSTFDCELSPLVRPMVFCQALRKQFRMQGADSDVREDHHWHSHRRRRRAGLEPGDQ